MTGGADASHFELQSVSSYGELKPKSPDGTDPGPRSWLGSLITGSRDASGLLFRRNRYLDPKSGRFTQEDPIGLAGGLNTYGFANGDPVSYRDPYGLCVRQNDREGRPIETECERFAAFADRMAARARDDDHFVRILGYYVSGFLDNGTANRRPGPSPLTFGSSGFRPELDDGDNHAPRHFTAYVVLAFQQGKWKSNRAAFIREQWPICRAGCSREDIHLGDLGAQLGQLLRDQKITRAQVGQWIRDNL